jgi:4-deoxy-L-threo-5-hexosulose-uronate ketol-isomerase
LAGKFKFFQIMNFEVRYPSHPEDFNNYNTERIRKHFHIGNLFQSSQVNMVYSHFDRMIVAGIQPGKNSLKLEAADYQMTENFLDRREMGIINIGGNGVARIDNESYELDNLDALYVGRGKKELVFISEDQENPSKFYMNSALAHKELPSRLVKKDSANPVYLGDKKHSNERVLNQYIVPDIVETCQLMMGVTTVFEGSSWNTMPCHRHELRMEVYLYFNIDEDQAVCHLMGEPGETRPVWLKNEEAVISPSWSIHTASGTSPYSFIWGMSGSDSEMDGIKITDLK